VLIPTKRCELGYSTDHEKKKPETEPPVLTLENKTDILTTLVRTISSGSSSQTLNQNQV
jgi:hypothetical protein